MLSSWAHHSRGGWEAWIPGVVVWCGADGFAEVQHVALRVWFCRPSVWPCQLGIVLFLYYERFSTVHITFVVPSGDNSTVEVSSPLSSTISKDFTDFSGPLWLAILARIFGYCVVAMQVPHGCL